MKFRHLVDDISFSDDFIVPKQIWCLHQVGCMNLFPMEGEQTFVSWHQEDAMSVINSKLSWHNRAWDHRDRGLKYIRNSYCNSLVHLPSEQNLGSLCIDKLCHRFVHKPGALSSWEWRILSAQSPAMPLIGNSRTSFHIFSPCASRHEATSCSAE